MNRKPHVRLIEGYHLTAADKRNILDCIAFLRDQDRLEHPLPLLRRQGSPKRYALAPHKAGAAFYSVVIKAEEKNDYGTPVERSGHYVIETRGVDPLDWDRLLGIEEGNPAATRNGLS